MCNEIFSSPFSNGFLPVHRYFITNFNLRISYWWYISWKCCLDRSAAKIFYTSFFADQISFNLWIWAGNCFRRNVNSWDYPKHQYCRGQTFGSGRIVDSLPCIWEHQLLQTFWRVKAYPGIGLAEICMISLADAECIITFRPCGFSSYTIVSQKRSSIRHFGIEVLDLRRSPAIIPRMSLLRCTIVPLEFHLCSLRLKRMQQNIWCRNQWYVGLFSNLYSQGPYKCTWWKYISGEGTKREIYEAYRLFFRIHHILSVVFQSFQSYSTCRFKACSSKKVEMFFRADREIKADGLTKFRYCK